MEARKRSSTMQVAVYQAQNSSHTKREGQQSIATLFGTQDNEEDDGGGNDNDDHVRAVNNISNCAGTVNNNANNTGASNHNTGVIVDEHHVQYENDRQDMTLKKIEEYATSIPNGSFITTTLLVKEDEEDALDDLSNSEDETEWAGNAVGGSVRGAATTSSRGREK